MLSWVLQRDRSLGNISSIGTAPEDDHIIFNSLVRIIAETEDEETRFETVSCLYHLPFKISDNQMEILKRVRSGIHDGKADRVIGDVISNK